jgi:nicotinamidase-related amidase
VPAICANDHYCTWHAEFSDVLKAYNALPGVAGEVARLLAPAPDDLTILKPRHSAFFASPVDLLLREIGARELAIVGLATDMCVQLTAVEAYMHGYSAWVPRTARQRRHLKQDVRHWTTWPLFSSVV